MTSAARDARENACMPPRERHGRLGPMGKTGISITASSISSHSLTAVLVRLTTGHCSRATDHNSPVPRPTPGPAGSGRAQTLPRWLLPDTDSRIGKDRTGSNLDERSLYIEYVTEPGDSCGKIKPFFPLAVAQPLNILSRPETLNASGSRRACRRPSAAMPVRSLISPSSPKQLGMVSLELRPQDGAVIVRITGRQATRPRRSWRGRPGRTPGG